jgi:GT2 family glycosyltransferase
MTKPRLSACIVTFRSNLEQVKAAVESVMRSAVPHRIHIVDNDSGPDYVAQLRQHLPCAVIESGANNGFGFGHNVGWRQAPQADYHLVLNPDVVVHEGTLEAMVAKMDAEPEIGLLVPRVHYPDGRLQPLNKRLPSVFDLFARRFLPGSIQRMPFFQRKMDRYIMLDVGYERELDVPFASGCCMLFRRDMLERIGGFDEGYFMYLEDADISIRVREAGYRVVYTPDAVITHHWARGSHTSRRLFKVMLDSMWYHYRKWGWTWW